MYKPSKELHDFAVESNNIEGVITEKEHISHALRLFNLLTLDRLSLKDIVEFNTAGELRNKKGMDVKVGSHIAPLGNTKIENELNNIINKVNAGYQPFFMHCEFETLHPFMDGNGRTGRAIWAWQMVKQHNYNLKLKFLQAFYYQTLSNIRKNGKTDAIPSDITGVALCATSKNAVEC